MGSYPGCIKNDVKVGHGSEINYFGTSTLVQANFSSYRQQGGCLQFSVADQHHVDVDPDPACHLDPDPDPAILLVTLIQVRILPFTLTWIQIRIIASR